MRRAVRALLVGTVLVALVGGGAFAWLKLAPRHVPDGQPPLRHLSADTLPELRRDFNARPGSVRLLALLSPT